MEIELYRGSERTLKMNGIDREKKRTVNCFIRIHIQFGDEFKILTERVNSKDIYKERLRENECKKEERERARVRARVREREEEEESERKNTRRNKQWLYHRRKDGV